MNFDESNTVLNRLSHGAITFAADDESVTREVCRDPDPCWFK